MGGRAGGRRAEGRARGSEAAEIRGTGSDRNHKETKPRAHTHARARARPHAARTQVDRRVLDCIVGLDGESSEVTLNRSAQARTRARTRMRAHARTHTPTHTDTRRTLTCAHARTHARARALSARTLRSKEERPQARNHNNNNVGIIIIIIIIKEYPARACVGTQPGMRARRRERTKSARKCSHT